MTARVDDEALWVQNSADGPLLRLQLDVDALAVWTDGLTLAVAGRFSAWCRSVPPVQEIVSGAEAVPVGWGGSGTVLRADADGRVQRVHTDRPVRGLRTTAQALWVQLDVEPWSLRSLGAGTCEVCWSSRCNLSVDVVSSAGDGPSPVADRCYASSMRTISQRELRNDSGKILRELRDGEEFEVTINGESFGILRMSPPPAKPQRFVSADALRSLYAEAPLSAEQADAWKQDVRDGFDDELDDPYTRATGSEKR